MVSQILRAEIFVISRSLLRNSQNIREYCMLNQEIRWIYFILVFHIALFDDIPDKEIYEGILKKPEIRNP